MTNKTLYSNTIKIKLMGGGGPRSPPPLIHSNIVKKLMLLHPLHLHPQPHYRFNDANSFIIFISAMKTPDPIPYLVSLAVYAIAAERCSWQRFNKYGGRETWSRFLEKVGQTWTRINLSKLCNKRQLVELRSIKALAAWRCPDDVI